jgi:hypothetical protein
MKNLYLILIADDFGVYVVEENSRKAIKAIEEYYSLRDGVGDWDLLDIYDVTYLGEVDEKEVEYFRGENEGEINILSLIQKLLKKENKQA